MLASIITPHQRDLHYARKLIYKRPFLGFYCWRTNKMAPATKRSPMTIRIELIVVEGGLIIRPITNPMSAEPIPRRNE